MHNKEMIEIKIINILFQQRHGPKYKRTNYIDIDKSYDSSVGRVYKKTKKKV